MISQCRVLKHVHELNMAPLINSQNLLKYLLSIFNFSCSLITHFIYFFSTGKAAKMKQHSIASNFVSAKN